MCEASHGRVFGEKLLTEKPTYIKRALAISK